MTAVCPTRFSQPVNAATIAVVDVETTGIDIGRDEVVEIAIVLFRDGKQVDSVSSFINPEMPIPDEAIALHGITNADVANAPVIGEFWRGLPHRFVDDVQFCSYSGFDKHFVPKSAPIDHVWPWLDVLSIVRAVDPYVRGKGRHKLEATCLRHDIPLVGAHRAEQDAVATGLLLYKLLAEAEEDGGPTFETLGDMLEWTQIQEAKSWGNFYRWLAKQPKQEQPHA